MNAFLTYAFVAAVFVVLSLPAWSGHLRDRRIDRQLRAAARADRAADRTVRAAVEARPGPKTQPEPASTETDRARRIVRPLVQAAEHEHRDPAGTC